MLDEVEVGRHYKGVRPHYYSLALVTTGMCLTLAFTSKLHSTLVPQSVWVLSFSHVLGGRSPHSHICLVYALVVSRYTAWKERLKWPRNTKYSAQL
jgi:hypothetical protein